MSRYLEEQFKELSAYKPGEQPQDKKYIKLNTNESPFPPSEDLSEAVRQAASDLNLYPDPELLDLRRALASIMPDCIGPDNIFISNGSDDILYMAFKAFTGQNRFAVFPAISYGFYEIFAKFKGCKYYMPPLDGDYRINPEDYTGKEIRSKIFPENEDLQAGLIVIANPNAPTGIALSPKEIEGILRNNPDSVVLVDEAYVDFGNDSCVDLVEKYDNLLVSRTFSKSASLAGARLGFAIADQDLIADLELMKYSINPYSVNRMTEAAGMAVVEDIGYYRENCRKIMRTREWTKGELDKMGFSSLASSANFILTGHPSISGGKLYEELKARGILVRYFDQEGLSDKIRLTIGNRKDMEACLDALRDIIR